jgi:hypothetical protein
MNKLCSLVSYLLLATFSVCAESAVCQQKNCIAVVDAGSTGSRVHIYAYDLDSNNAPIAINELWSKKIKPGFATLEPTQDVINAYLGNLFLNAPEQNVPVYFYATAGMRLLPQPKQQLYYQNVEKWFATHAEWPLVTSKTITGTEEGIFGWLAINYQLGAFNDPTGALAGSMDMGGASVQVAFPVKNSGQINPNDLVSIDIAGRHIDLFVKSFLGLGQTLLSQQFLDNEHCYPSDYLLPSGLKAKGDAQLCKQDIKKLINNVHQVNQVVKPAINQNTPSAWYVIGGLASMADDKPFVFQNKQLTTADLLQQADNNVCHQSWNTLYAQYPNNDYLSIYCLAPSYYSALLVDGYGIKPQQPINYIASGPGSDWTVGVVLHHP